MYIYAQTKNYKMHIYAEKKVIEVKNEVKRNFLGRNDGDFKNRFLNLMINLFLGCSEGCSEKGYAGM